MLGTGPLESSPNLRETVTRLRRLVELSTTLNSTLNLNDLLQLIIQTAAEILECDATSILLYDEKDDHLFFAAATGSDPKKLAEIPVPLEGSLAGTIFRTNRPLILNQLEGDPRHYKQASRHVGFQARSLLGVPMRIRDRTTGVLEALNKRNGPFTQTDQHVLTVVASHAAVAVHNAQLVQALKQAYERVSTADQLKSSFLALASHELRTPLGIIIGYATFLREESQGELSEHAEHVLNAAMQMRALLEDMTNLTLLETAESTFKSRAVAIQDVLEKACEEIDELASAKAQTLVFDFPKQPLQVTADSKKLTAAFVNLLHNAVRFSPEGGQIGVGAKREQDGVLSWVQDNGIGIPPDQLGEVFQKFYQIESPNVRHYSGMGIGLTIAKGLIEAQGGRIWAESEGENKGSTFKVWLPTADQSPL
ncbi:MAG: GAF domain-containing sensor histidine kinase [Chloroflexi bacterium]|nr:GAF domain-containing sensor histidine kinase [Chloroflexota bacterium]